MSNTKNSRDSDSLTKKLTEMASNTAKKQASKMEQKETTSRVKHYVDCMKSQNVTGLFEALLEDMDKDKILNEVEETKEKYPDLSSIELSDKEIHFTAKAMSSMSFASGLAWVVPGVGIPLGLAASAGEIIGIMVYQSRLVVKIAAYHGLDINAKERARDVAVCVASSAAGKGSSTGAGIAAGVALKKFGPKLAQMVTGKAVTIGVKSIPVFGAVAGVVGGAVGGVTNYCAVKGTGKYALKMYSENSETVKPSASAGFDKALIYVAILVAKADGEIADEERAIIQTLIEESYLDDFSRFEVLAKIQSDVQLSDIPCDFSDEEKQDLVRAAIRMSMADGNLDQTEFDIINQLAKHLGIEQGSLGALVAASI